MVLLWCRRDRWISLCVKMATCNLRMSIGLHTPVMRITLTDSEYLILHNATNICCQGTSAISSVTTDNYAWMNAYLKKYNLSKFTKFEVQVKVSCNLFEYINVSIFNVKFLLVPYHQILSCVLYFTFNHVMKVSANLKFLWKNTTQVHVPKLFCLSCQK